MMKTKDALIFIITEYLLAPEAGVGIWETIMTPTLIPRAEEGVGSGVVKYLSAAINQTK